MKVLKHLQERLKNNVCRPLFNGFSTYVFEYLIFVCICKQFLMKLIRKRQKQLLNMDFSHAIYTCMNNSLQIYVYYIHKYCIVCFNFNHSIQLAKWTMASFLAYFIFDCMVGQTLNSTNTYTNSIIFYHSYKYSADVEVKLLQLNNVDVARTTTHCEVMNGIFSLALRHSDTQIMDQNSSAWSSPVNERVISFNSKYVNNSAELNILLI